MASSSGSNKVAQVQAQVDEVLREFFICSWHDRCFVGLFNCHLAPLNNPTMIAPLLYLSSRTMTCFGISISRSSLSCKVSLTLPRFLRSDAWSMFEDNINKAMQRGEELESLNTKTEDLQNSSLQFKKGANEVRKQMWWKDFKMKMILGGVVLAIIIIIIS
ncbi:synaptobrevin-domain-containing protein [Zopfochytrium polystomum]|nr:synaptobrevin-domain-containing protein [Zopfochytrium polystomum]